MLSCPRAENSSNGVNLAATSFKAAKVLRNPRLMLIVTDNRAEAEGWLPVHPPKNLISPSQALLPTLPKKFPECLLKQILVSDQPDRGRNFWEDLPGVGRGRVEFRKDSMKVMLGRERRAMCECMW